MDDLRLSPDHRDDLAIAGADRFEPPDSTAEPGSNDPPPHIEGYPIPGDGAADGGAPEGTGAA